jgi:hypothetical protein
MRKRPTTMVLKKSKVKPLKSSSGSRSRKRIVS